MSSVSNTDIGLGIIEEFRDLGIEELKEPEIQNVKN
jgi:hypothetical protein